MSRLSPCVITQINVNPLILLFCLFGGRGLGIGIAGSKVNRTHTTCCKSLNNIALLKNLVMDSPEHMAELGLVDADVVFLILKNNFTILLLHLAKDDNIERLPDVWNGE